MSADSVTIDAGIWLARPEPLPTAGVPLAVKDLFDTAGLTTTYGSVLFADHVPDRTATAVARLERAGYTNVGKTNLHEFAYGVTSQNQHFGTVPNPIAPGRIAGGSSGGSGAALAAGQADAALGTDSGGSIRIPAACCGVVGFKPTYGLVQLDGCYPLAPTFDHAGPMARSVADCTRMLEVLAPGFRPAPPPTLADLRVGTAWLDRCDPLVRERLHRAAALLPGARAIELPLPEGTSPLFQSEVADVHRDLFAENGDAYGANVRAKIERCLEVTEAEAAEAARRREDYRETADRAIADLDLLLVPTLASVAPPLPDDERDVREALIRFTYPFNLLSWPALALPAGPAEDGLPASLQLAGRDDALVLAAGEALEASLGRGTA
ncbi:MAG TPA: amidase [Gaiellaceae bacterium]|jgi:aspartyl-tRNA(Asn)/glutamyl-tRNA(Gln) amidotransferase subunit A|nr:amidase [Gaiellaceae bacterium]